MGKCRILDLSVFQDLPGFLHLKIAEELVLYILYHFSGNIYIRISPGFGLNAAIGILITPVDAPDYEVLVVYDKVLFMEMLFQFQLYIQHQLFERMPFFEIDIPVILKRIIPVGLNTVLM
ncbi:hypothetical protein D9M68_686930 [compost metagenome]